MRDIQAIRQAMLGFTGSEQWHRWSALFQRDLLTDGAKFVADECEAYWLMDAIASWQHEPKLKEEAFQVWHLNRDPVKGGSRWLLWAEDGNFNEDDASPWLVRQEIEFSDFPLDSIKLFAARNELGGITIMLPSEY